MESKDQKKLNSHVPMASLRPPNAISRGLQVLGSKGSPNLLHLHPQKHQSPPILLLFPAHRFRRASSPRRRRLTGIRRVHLRATNQQSLLPQKSIRLTQAFSHAFHPTLGRQLGRP
ncbi:hypothetical protein COP2_027179 [Malus domestica]